MSTTHPVRREHLSPEELAAYIDRGLSLSERNRAEEHLATCDQCMMVLAASARTISEMAEAAPSVEPDPPLVSRRAIICAVVAAILVATILLLPGACRGF